MGIQKTVDEAFQKKKSGIPAAAMKKSTKRRISSPLKGVTATKRAAFDNLTNAREAKEEQPLKPMTRAQTRRSIELAGAKNAHVVQVNAKPEVKRPPKDIDDTNDFLYSPEYAQDVFTNMREKEEANPIRKYLHRQTSVNAKVRTVLVDWMVEVQESFELYHETLYLSVKYVDRYLEKEIVPREELQLFGMAAMLIASKFEESQPPLVDDFIYICDDAYSREQLLAAERTMLTVLNYSLNTPIPYRFLRRFARAADASMEIHTLARFICELTLQEHDYVEHKPSLLAASALYLALKMKDAGTWTPTLEYYSNYTVAAIMPCVRQLNALVAQTPKESVSVVRKKYSHQVFFQSSNVPALKLD